MRRIVRPLVGSILLLAGLLMLILPGPALIVIPLGLGILAKDFPWAKAVMQRARIWFTRKKVRQAVPALAQRSLSKSKGNILLQANPSRVPLPTRHERR